jgi:hypothetical protein
MGHIHPIRRSCCRQLGALGCSIRLRTHGKRWQGFVPPTPWRVRLLLLAPQDVHVLPQPLPPREYHRETCSSRLLVQRRRERCRSLRCWLPGSWLPVAARAALSALVRQVQLGMHGEGMQGQAARPCVQVGGYLTRHCHLPSPYCCADGSHGSQLLWWLTQAAGMHGGLEW